MADDKEPMQADGGDGVGIELAREKDPPSAGRPDMNENLGQSAGGAYPNPHTGKGAEEFHGGQSVAGYFGDGRLGSKNVGNNDNAVNEED